MSTRRTSPPRGADALKNTSDGAAPTTVDTSSTGGEAPALASGPGSQIVLGLAVAAALVAAVADTAPTGIRWWDAVLTGAMAAVLTVASSYCSGRFLAVVATCAAAFAGWTVWLAVAFVALVVAILGEWFDKPRRITGAITGALVVQVYLRLEPLGFFGLPSVLGAAALVAVAAAGYPNASSKAKRVAVRFCLGCGVLAAGAFVAGGLVVLSARSSTEDGIAAARTALAAARDGDTPLLSTSLEAASDGLGAAEARLDHVLAKPLQLMPVVAQHQRALKVAVQQGAALASDASAMVSDQDVDALRFEQGSFDLAALASLGPQLQQTAQRLTTASTSVDQARTDWLLPVVDRRIQELVDEIDDVLPEALLSADAATILPAMLGQDGARRYLILVGSPGETRPLGGFVGGYALLELAGGKATLVESGRAPELATLAPPAVLDNPAGYPTEFLESDPITFPQNLTMTPSIHTVARAARDMYPLLAGAPIDGVMYLDPYTIAAITELTGPLAIEGRVEPLTKQNAPDFFFKEQYTIYDTRTDSFGAIELALEAAVRGLADADLPGPEELGRVLGPAARAGRLQIVTFDEEENRFLRSAKLQRVFTLPAAGDSIALVQANASASKLDAFLQRDVVYRTTVDDEGVLRAALNVTLTSTIPPDAPEYTLGLSEDVLGLNKVLLTVYSPHEVTSVTVRGRPHDLVSEREFGFWRHSLFIVPVPANESAQVRVELEGQIDTQSDYVLHVWQQPLVNDDTWRVEAQIRDNDPLSESFVLTEITTVFDGQ